MDQEQVIECPSCRKRYRLRGVPPPIFSCRNCNTQMDLSAFREPEPVPVAPPAGHAGSPARRSAGQAPVHRHGARHRTHGRRARHGAAGAEDEGHGERHHYVPHSKGPNTALLLGSVGGVLVAVIALVVFLGTREKPEPKEEPPPAVPTTVAQAPSSDLPDEVEEPKAEPAPVKPDKPVDVENVRPELGEGDYGQVPLPEGKTKYTWSQARIQTYPYPDHVTPEERNQIDEWVRMLTEGGGRDMRDAETELVKLDGFPKEGAEFKAVGRLISEFKNVIDKYGSNTPEAMSRLMTIDRTLRKIDGAMEREFNDKGGLNINTPEREAERVIKKWNWWYDLEKWRLRRQPWDVREDVADDQEVDPDAE